jgi:hypothetical protein
MSALPERSPAVRLAELQAACTATAEANGAPLSPERITELVEVYDHALAIIDRVDAAAVDSGKWRALRGISSEIAIEMRATLKRAGAVL